MLVRRKSLEVKMKNRVLFSASTCHDIPKNALLYILSFREKYTMPSRTLMVSALISSTATGGSRNARTEGEWRGHGGRWGHSWLLTNLHLQS